MKLLSKIAAFVVGTALASCTLASTAYYGLPKRTSTQNVTTQANVTAQANAFSNVTLYNYTGELYVAHATFQFSPGYDMYLYPNGAHDQFGNPTYIITYDINYPDTEVYITINRQSDGWIAYSGYKSFGTISIGPYTTANKLPAINLH